MEKAIGMFASLIFVLSMLGVAVAHWNDNVQIKGTIQTGSLTVGWDNLTFGENDERCGKEVASISARLEDNEIDCKTGKMVYKTLKFKIDNAYPCYRAWIEVDIKNAGSIPADWENIEVVWMCPDNIAAWCEAFEVTCSPCYSLPIQIDPCHSLHIRCEIHIKQEAPECHTFCGKLRLNFVQWSGEACMPPE